MSFWEKLTTQVKGLLNDGVDAFSDDGRTLRQALRDKDVSIKDVETALVEARTQLNFSSGKLETAKAEVAKFEKYAKEAVSRGNEQLAISALQDSDKAKKKVDILQQQAESNKKTVDVLTERFEEMVADREREQNQVDELTARSRAAAATQHVYDLAQTGVGYSSKNTDQVFERMKDKVERAEAGATAMVDIHREKKPVDKYAELNNSDEDMQARLAALRKEVGK